MCLDCQELFAYVADLHAELTAQTKRWRAGDENGAAELTQLRAACAQARTALEQHRTQHYTQEVS